ncbi:hypothetical protein BDY21DRAFT_364711 [Lineolata rhizophorae]|uniref:Uncharacterized protein n=1 Tax=Lineolata rhizophorae TaxID=578093 RepID=A0A6A6NXV4_9PEZI|nr:hypothetical protein BDY21DRAFT_364711 [Lineolata rhizophorae]
MDQLPPNPTMHVPNILVVPAHPAMTVASVPFKDEIPWACFQDQDDFLGFLTSCASVFSPATVCAAISYLRSTSALPDVIIIASRGIKWRSPPLDVHDGDLTRIMDKYVRRGGVLINMAALLTDFSLTEALLRNGPVSVGRFLGLGWKLEVPRVDQTEGLEVPSPPPATEDGDIIMKEEDFDCCEISDMSTYDIIEADDSSSDGSAGFKIEHASGRNKSDRYYFSSARSLSNSINEGDIEVEEEESNDGEDSDAEFSLRFQTPSMRSSPVTQIGELEQAFIARSPITFVRNDPQFSVFEFTKKFTAVTQEPLGGWLNGVNIEHQMYNHGRFTRAALSPIGEGWFGYLCGPLDADARRWILAAMCRPSNPQMTFRFLGHPLEFEDGSQSEWEMQDA